MRDRTIRIVAGYGAGLRARLEELALPQAWLAKVASLSRQTLSRAVNRDELSELTRSKIEDALRGAGSPLSRSASSQTRRGNSGTGTGLAILGDTLCNATDLVQWSDRRDAQGMLPLLMRKLIRATAGGCSKLHIRTHEGVQLPGWDGIVHCERASTFVPEGSSGWEMSVARRPGSKAESDWRKRTDNSDSLQPDDASFVFVTSRRWSSKEEWARRKEGEGPWRRVAALDADDLATWLDDAPAVHLWLSILIGKRPRGVVDLESWWDEWSGGTRPPLPPEFLLAGREQALEEIRRQLMRGPGRAWAIQAESQEEAVACLYCVARAVGEEQAQALAARALVVETADVFRSLIHAEPPLALVPTFEAEGLASAAASAGHMVVVPLDRKAPRASDLAVEVGPVGRQPAATALENAGLPSDRARAMAELARESLAAFRRQCASSPSVRQPEWSKPAEARSVIPALLAGSWNDDHPLDRDVVAGLGPSSYEALRDTLVPQGAAVDPLVRRRGGTWYLVSARDAWDLLGQYVLPDDIDRFSEAAVEMLSQSKAVYSGPPEERWMAWARSDEGDCSDQLRVGLAMSLAIMGARDRDSLSPLAQTARTVVRDILQRANGDWRTWASLGDQLPLLAEAAPDTFLEAVEDGLRGTEPVLADVFASHGEHPLHPQGIDGLVGAMEVLAWSVDHFGAVVSLLARLDRLDPGSEFRRSRRSHGSSGRRPSSVLKTVFRSWLPETNASLDERLAALDRLRISCDDAAWSLMRSMLPDPGALAWPSAKPRVRAWAPSEARRTSWEERARTTSEIVTRMVSDAGSCGRRWTDLIERLDRLPEGERDRVMTAVEEVGADERDADARAAIWEKVSTTVHNHRRYGKGRWAMPAGDLARLEAILDRIRPSDPVTRFGWLFADVLPQEDKQIQAATAVFEQGGLSALAELATAVERPHDLGFAAASMSGGLADSQVVLSRYLEHKEPPLNRFALGFVRGRCSACGRSWVFRKLERADLSLSPEQEAALLTVLPFGRETWEAAAARGEAVRREYWRRVRPLPPCAPEDMAEGVLRLVGADRLLAAASMLARCEKNVRSAVPPEVVSDVLGKIVPVDKAPDHSGHHIAEPIASLLGWLAETDHDRRELAWLEWRLLPDAFPHQRPPGALHEILAEDAEFLVKVVAMAYTREDAGRERLDERERRMARGASSLLSSWRSLPGEDGGRVSRRRLLAWITQAREGLENTGRLRVGLEVIGAMLSGSPHGRDGSWPCSAVREVIETVASTDLEKGLEVAVFNRDNRGVADYVSAGEATANSEFARQYEGYAIAVRATHPRTARMLRRIAESYRLDPFR